MRNLMIFASILALKTLPKNGPPSTFFRHFPQDTSKMPPRRPKMPPRHLQDASKTLQEASKTALRPPKTPPRCLWTAQSASKLPQVAVKHSKNTTKLKDFKSSWIFTCHHRSLTDDTKHGREVFPIAGLGAALPPQPKTGGLGGSDPQPNRKNLKFRENSNKLT